MLVVDNGSLRILWNKKIAASVFLKRSEYWIIKRISFSFNFKFLLFWPHMSASPFHFRMVVELRRVVLRDSEWTNSKSSVEWPSANQRRWGLHWRARGQRESIQFGSLSDEKTEEQFEIDLSCCVASSNMVFARWLATFHSLFHPFHDFSDYFVFQTFGISSWISPLQKASCA